MARSNASSVRAGGETVDSPSSARKKQIDKPEGARESKWGDRDEELCEDEDIREQVIELIKDVEKGFQGQWERSNDQMDYWDLYDGILGGRQAYAGNSQVFVPSTKTAVNARKTRFVNQLFPRSARNVDCITSDDKPWAVMSLLEHYIRKTKLRTQVFPALLKNGDMEGQYNLYVAWADTERHIAYKKNPTLRLVEDDDIEIDDPTAEGDEYDVEEETTYHQQPVVDVLADSDVLVLPANAANIGSAISQRGLVAIIRRWTKAKLQQMADDGEVDEEAAESIIEQMKSDKDDPNAPDAEKKHADAAGITMSDGVKILYGYEVWKLLERGDEWRLCKILYGGGKDNTILSVKRNPYWCDKVPVLSASVDKVSNVFKGVPPVKATADLQYAINDIFNESMDSATYGLCPIVMTDPSKNPRTGSMVLNLAAIWETDPKSTTFAQFPQLWKDGLQIVQQLEQKLFQTLSVSPAMLPQSSGGKSKRNQAEIAAEQQIDILSTADSVTNIEDEIATPLLRWFVDLDHQFRDREITVRQYGQLGLQETMEPVPPLQNDRRYEFRWFGIEAARSTQQIQQQIAAVNVIKGTPPDMMPGRQLDISPFLQMLCENAFGPRVAPQIFKSIKDKLSIDAKMENSLLVEGLALPVHELDDDKEHLQTHIQAMQESNGDPSGAVREHMMMHTTQMQKKMQMQLAAMAGMQRGLPGSPGGAGPGAAGAPKPGAQPMPPRGGQNPPGAIHQDRMADPSAAPRR
jgi:hypothetical protein